MELQQIRYFLAIHEHGGFSRAAQACDVSQPALTAAIKKIETEIGAPLFHELVVPFELTAPLLLAAIVAAIALWRRQEGPR